MTDDPVRAQYETLPFPERDPEDERKRLIGTWLDDLGLLNHRCFRGRRDFTSPFRALVAGGGTGDGTIFLAEQLRGTPGRVVHLDVSRASIEVAQRRAAIRQLDNIDWVHAPIEAVPELGLGRFDYINCVGVLHHLSDPEIAFDGLLASLNDDGAMAVLLYGAYGRTGVYQMQALLRMLGCPQLALPSQIAVARSLLAALPPTNWFRCGEALINDHKLGGDAGIVDLLLHARDRAYTVPEIHAWFADRHGLHIWFSDVHRGALPYQPRMRLRAADPRLLDLIDALPLHTQQAVAELIGGDLISHSFYLTRRSDVTSPYGDPDYVPFFITETTPATGADLARLIEQHRNRPFLLRHGQSGLEVALDPGRYVRAIFALIDGSRTFGEIFSALRALPQFRPDPPSDEALFAEFRPWYDALGSIERLLLRHRASPPVRIAIPAP
ncbi:MAG: class I SAM-dependent methyltransferase [Burkholderiaceae bacterium]